MIKHIYIDCNAEAVCINDLGRVCFHVCFHTLICSYSMNAFTYAYTKRQWNSFVDIFLPDCSKEPFPLLGRTTYAIPCGTSIFILSFPSSSGFLLLTFISKLLSSQPKSYISIMIGMSCFVEFTWVFKAAFKSWWHLDLKTMFFYKAVKSEFVIIYKPITLHSFFSLSFVGLFSKPVLLYGNLNSRYLKGSVNIRLGLPFNNV